jgi:hypothetical protein
MEREDCMSLARIGLFAGVSIATLAMAAWVSALAGVHFVRIHTEIAIDAPKEVVWAVISDFASYPAWNPLMVEARATANVGQRMEWTSVINGSARTYNATIDRVAPGQELAWTGPVSSPARALFWGHHQLIIEEQPGGRVRFVNTEGFGGAMSIILRGFLENDVRKAYAAHNAALKARAEALAAQR